MNIRYKINRYWDKLKIARKFKLAFGLLFTLIVLVSIAGYAALTTVRIQTEAAIFTSAEIQRLVLQMDGGLQEARRLERDFFIRYPSIGFQKAHETYAVDIYKKIKEVVKLSSQLQKLFSETDVSEALREDNVNLNLYLSAAGHYAESFQEAVELVRQLENEQNGLRVTLNNRAQILENFLKNSRNLALMNMFLQIYALEKEYLATRQRFIMHQALNKVNIFENAINASTVISRQQKTLMLKYLKNYAQSAKELAELDVHIRNKVKEFDRQAKTIDPITDRLVELAGKEVELTRKNIEHVSLLMIIFLILVTLGGIGISGFVAKLFNRSITENVIRLTAATEEMQAGNLKVFANIENHDEIGQLAYAFNSMARRIESLVENLQQKVEERTRELIQSEKMAALGQLVAGVAHEINTPLGAIRAAIGNIEESLDYILKTPQLLEELSEEKHALFFTMLGRAEKNTVLISTREERDSKRSLTKQLEKHEITNSALLARSLTYMGLRSHLEEYLPLFQSSNSLAIVDTAYQIVRFQRNISNISLAVDRSSKVVFALKNHARRDQHGAKIQIELTENIETILTLYHNQLKHGIKIVREYQTVPPVMCYPDQLGQVWTNIIHNAIQAMQNKGTLLIEVLNKKSSIEVRVTDSGKGVPPEIQERIFDPFFTTKQPGEGTGLGLDIVAKIVKIHNGTIAVNSLPGKTTFSVSLPIHLTDSMEG